jgi:hypothetical protein
VPTVPGARQQRLLTAPPASLAEPSGMPYGTDQFINFRGSAFDIAEGDIGASAV